MILYVNYLKNNNKFKITNNYYLYQQIVPEGLM